MFLRVSFTVVFPDMARKLTYRWPRLHINLYEGLPGAPCILCKLPETTIMLLVGFWNL